MTGSDKIFFDTAPFIYLLENHEKHGLKVRDFIVREATFQESTFFISSITFAEFFVKPKKAGDQALIEKFKNKIKEFHFTVFSITPEIAEYSSALRADYSFLKTFDAIQIATAVSFGCNKFFTNDHALKKIKEIEIITVDDL